MPVYWRKDTSEASWWLRFQVKGRRVHERARGAETKRDAERVERDRRRAVEREIDKPTDTLDACAGRWWSEVGQHHQDPATADYRLARVVAGIGPETKMTAIDFDAVSAYVARRRLEPNRHGRMPSPASLNREIDLLRTVMNRSAERGIEVCRIAWRKIRLAEPEGRTFTLSHDDEAKIIAELPEDWRRLIAFLMVTGWRSGATCELQWSMVEKTIIRRTGKGGRTVIAAIDEVIAAILDCQRGAHPTHVFAMKGRRTTNTTARGVARPITPVLLLQEWHRACDRAGVARCRIHDLRHTAATRALAATRNIRVVQLLLGHTRVTTTERYAHVLEEEALLDAMEQTRKRTTERTRKTGIHLKSVK